jgi:hypothetical protein
MENSRTRAKLVQVISRSQSLDLSTTAVTRYRADGGTAAAIREALRQAGLFDADNSVGLSEGEVKKL